MGHANKGSSSQNNHWWPEGEDPISVNGANQTLSIPDSYGFTLIRRGTGVFFSVQTIEAEWFYGRVLEITVQPIAGTPSTGSVSFVAGGNMLINAGAQLVPAGATIRLRAVRNATGEKVWLQVGFQQYG